MCTVTVWRGSETVQVTMNRDERWGRAPELPPTLHREDATGVAWAAPADGERGGTWMGVNDRGMVACLLNGYTAEDLPLLNRSDVPSRGGLVPEVVSRIPDDARRWCESGLDPGPFPSFTLLVISAPYAVELTWRRGDRLRSRQLPDGWQIVSSSFWRPEEVLPWRGARFDEWRDGGAVHEHGVPTYNLLDIPGRSEWSPFMTRPISATRSITQVRVDDSSVKLRWWPRLGDQAIDPSRPRSELRLPVQTAPADAG